MEDEEFEKMKEKYVIMKETLLGINVCSEIKDIEQLEGLLNLEHHPGTSAGWKFSEEHGILVCSDDPNKRHYVFVC